MATKFAELFGEFAIKGIRLKNRVVAPPMYQGRPIVSAQGIGWYRRLAAGGVGMVIIEGISIRRFTEELTAASLRTLAETIHREGAAAVVQLTMQAKRAGTDPSTMTPAELDETVSLFGHAAQVCQLAGFEGAEPHGAHGFLLNQFFSPAKNRRTDLFGGDTARRCQMAVRIVEQIRKVSGPGSLLLYRHTPKGEGYGLTESLTLAHRLVSSGVDVLDISPAKEQEAADLAAPFKACGVPVLAVNGMEDAAAACGAIRAGRCDLVGLGRQLIADSRWPRLVQEGREGDIVACRKCDQACYGALRTGKNVACVQWKADEVAAWT